MTGRSGLGWLWLTAAVGACQQTVVLDSGLRDGAAGRDGQSSMVADGGAGHDGPSSMSDGPLSDARCTGDPAQSLPFSPEATEVIVALDRSAAMNAPFGSAGDTELDAAVNALSAVVQRYEPDQTPRNNHRPMHFAFLDFPDRAPDCSDPPGCCSSDVTETATSAAFNQIIDACGMQPNSCIQAFQRPTAAALSKADDFFSFNGPAPTGPRYLLLLTDGPPTGGCNLSPSDCSSAIRMIGSLTNLGVETVIVAIGDQSTEGCLLDLANAEGGTQPPYYYAAVTPVDLVSALGTITSAMAASACSLDLGPAPPSPNHLTVLLNGTPLGRDHIDGWDFSSSANNRITLYGAACQAYVQSGASAFDVVEGCVPGRATP